MNVFGVQRHKCTAISEDLLICMIYYKMNSFLGFSTGAVHCSWHLWRYPTSCWNER